MAETNALADVAMTWPVKASFVGYVKRLEDGEVSLADGAAETDAGYRFGSPESEVSFDVASQTGTLPFAGKVTFSGYWGALRVEINEPRVELTEGKGTLSVKIGGVIGTPRWEAIAGVEVSEFSGERLTLTVRLTAAGRMLLGEQYQVGQELDPAVISFRNIGK